MPYYEFEYGYKTRTEAKAIVEGDTIEDAEDIFYESFNIPDDLLFFKAIDQEVEILDGGMRITEHIDYPYSNKTKNQKIQFRIRGSNERRQDDT